jgi:hypothetical protein
MDKVICISCLNLYHLDHTYIILRYSKAKCTYCQNSGNQGLIISFQTRECTHSLGCSDVKIKFICEKEICDADLPDPDHHYPVTIYNPK